METLAQKGRYFAGDRATLVSELAATRQQLGTRDPTGPLACCDRINQIKLRRLRPLLYGWRNNNGPICH